MVVKLDMKMVDHLDNMLDAMRVEWRVVWMVVLLEYSMVDMLDS